MTIRYVCPVHGEYGGYIDPGAGIEYLLTWAPTLKLTHSQASGRSNCLLPIMLEIDLCS